MNTVPASTNPAGQLFNSFGEELVACDLCEALTTMTATKRCDRCWELEKRIRRDPELARKILKLMEAE